MTKMLFVNLPVRDVEKASAFWQAVGATKNEAFSQEGVAASMVFSDAIYFMLLSHKRFSDFTNKRIIDAKTEAGALLCFSAESREEVDETLARAVAAGGKAHPIDPQEVSDFMYGRSFEDLDGNGIELMWMDLEKMMAAGGAEHAAA